MKRVLTEGVLVALAGALAAFAANAISPRGLKLTRDYFYLGTSGTNAVALTNSSDPVVPGTHATPSSLAARLAAHGLSLIDSNQATQLFRDPRYHQGTVIFVDARDDQHYREGHIPAAWQLYYYQPEKYLPEVLQACQIANQIVVYCNGGDCEDSEFAAMMLASTVPKEKLFVYGGGMEEWKANGLPVETGARNSGQIQNSGK